MCAEEQRLYDPLIKPNFATTKAGRAYFSSRLKETSSLLIVATVEDCVVGYLCASLHKNEFYRKDARIAEISDMAVDKKNRRQGIGRLLYATFKDWAKSKRARILRVVASAGNTIALDFYKENGFKPMSIMCERQL